MKSHKTTWFLVSVFLLIIGFGWWQTSVSSKVDSLQVNGEKVVVYKSPLCGCCVKYVSYLEKNGFDVEVKSTKDMNSVKEKYGVPVNMESCHTMIVDDYVVEGHIPVEVVDQLLKDRPDISGIALPDMPAGSPGMPGRKIEPFKIYSLTATGTEVFGLY